MKISFGRVTHLLDPEMKKMGLRGLYGNAGMTRPGQLGGRSPPNKFTEPPSALEFLKITMHSRHFRNLLVVFLESLVEF